MTTAEEVETYKNINITSYVTTTPTLTLWIGVLVMMLIQKDIAKYLGLIVVCALMVESQIATIIKWQLWYTYRNRTFKAALHHNDLFYQILNAFQFISYYTFNLAHWLFAFSYLVLSFRIELTTKDLPENTYNFRLQAANILVCLFNAVITALVWVYSVKEEVKSNDIAF